MRQLIAGNWKMNGTLDSLREIEAMAGQTAGDGPELLICPPATLLHAASGLGGDVRLGAQDCHAKSAGAHTGDISAEMIRDLGARYVIVGHSERRTDHGETDAFVRAKAEAALRASLVPIICVGETEAERQAGETDAVLKRQTKGSLPEDASPDAIVIAYEPVWAIGTGRTAEPVDVVAAHRVIRDTLREVLGDGADGVRILYGGSVKPTNASELLALDGVDGALVGGASLKASDFLAISAAAPR